jgi:hypothetical protein
VSSPHSRSTLSLGALSLLVAGLIGAGSAAQQAAQPQAPPEGRVETMPLAEVRPGMEGIVRTVFEGDRVEEFRAEIVSVMTGFLGPHQDLILARLKGDRVEFTGVAAGMSGSPVYIGGRLVGALSYRMGSFAKEPIAGITPIDYMLKVGTGASPTRAQGSAAPLAAGISSGTAGLEPIDTPVVAAGIPVAALEIFAPDLGRLGLKGVIPGGGSGSSAPPADRSAAAALPALRAGEPVAAQLVSGDASLAATGTVTYVDGDRVFAFGHPAFLTGASEIPMARASIYLTLPSLEASVKMSHVLETVGTFRESRLPAMTGVLGPVPRTIPVGIEVAGEDSPRRSFHYDVVEHREFTPALVGLVTAASLLNTPWSSDETTVSLAGRIALEGHHDLVLNDLYTGFTAGQSAAGSMAQDVQGLFGAVYQNRFEQPRVRSIDLTVSTVEKSRLSLVEGVYPTRTELDPGDSVEFRVLVRPYRGQAYTRKLTYRVPEGAPPGPLVAYVGGANLMSLAERSVLSRQASQADDIDELITLINRLRSNNALYLKVTRRHGGAVVQNEVLPALPPSILSTLAANRSTGEVTPLAETTVYEDAIPLDQVLVGGTAIPLTIRP